MYDNNMQILSHDMTPKIYLAYDCVMFYVEFRYVDLVINIWLIGIGFENIFF